MNLPCFTNPCTNLIIGPFIKFSFNCWRVSLLILGLVVVVVDAVVVESFVPIWVTLFFNFLVFLGSSSPSIEKEGHSNSSQKEFLNLKIQILKLDYEEFVIPKLFPRTSFAFFKCSIIINEFIFITIVLTERAESIFAFSETWLCWTSFTFSLYLIFTNQLIVLVFWIIPDNCERAQN